MRPNATLNSSTALYNSLNESTNQFASLNRSARAANALVGAHLIATNDFQNSIDEDIQNFGQQWNAGWFLTQNMVIL